MNEMYLQLLLWKLNDTAKKRAYIELKYPTIKVTAYDWKTNG